MKPGRELDALIEEKVMGPKLKGCLCGSGEWCRACSSYPPAYSTDIAAAWAVAEKMNERQTYTGYRFAILFDGDAWCVGFQHPDLKGGTWFEKLGYSSVSAAHAICLAGLQEIGST